METLEIVIGIVFIFLLLSLLGTIVQEFYTTSTSLRGRVLLDGLARLLEIKYKDDGYGETSAKDTENGDSPSEKHRFTLSSFLASAFSTRHKRPDTVEEEKTDFKDFIRDSKIYKELKGRYFFNLIESLPSYLSSEQVMAIYQEVLTKEKYRTNSGKTKDNSKCIRKKGEGYSCEKWSHDLQTICKASLEEDSEEKEVNPLKLKMAQNKMAVDFEQMMDRISEQFKRRLQATLFFIGLLIAIIFNADTLQIYRHLSTDPESLVTVMGLADDFANNSGMGTYIVSPDGNNLAVGPNDTAIFQAFQDMRSQVSALIQNEIQSVRSPLGLGWNIPSSETTVVSKTRWALSSVSVMKLFGWVITALAISLGSPFWFDMLSRLVNIRNAGKRPESRGQSTIPEIPVPVQERAAPPEATVS